MRQLVHARYGFKEPRTRAIQRPDDPLYRAFEKWIRELNNENWQRQYEKAVDMITPIGEIHPNEAHALVHDFEPTTIVKKNVGLFVSACYTKSPERAIFCDIENPDIYLIGYCLPKDKVLVNCGNTGHWFGWMSDGVVVNNGRARKYFAQNSHGVAINNGEADMGFAWDSSGIVVANDESGFFFADGSHGIVFNLQYKKQNGKTHGFLLDAEECSRIPKLERFLDGLTETTKQLKDAESAKRFFEMYGEMPAEGIENEVKRILEENGYGSKMSFCRG